MPEIYWIIIEALVKAVSLVAGIQLMAAVNVYLERRIAGAIQNRIGPNRVGPFGVLQPFADVFKLFFKEDIVPKAADNFFHSLAPVISLGVAIALWAVIPFGEYIELFGRKIYMGIAPNVNIGILFILAMTSVGVYGITLAGWSSNSKYSMYGGLRSAAQMISYELSMGLAIVGVILISGSLALNDIVYEQQSWGGWKWNVFLQPLGFIIFFVSSFAETNRAPFDLPEAEQELVSGYNTEYSSMRFGTFFLAEYANMFTSSTFMTILYFGGWSLPVSPEVLGLEPGSIALAALQFLTFLIKTMIFVFIFIWVRWSVPRFRYDQLMDLGWKVLLPLALINVVLTAIGVMIF